MKNKKAFKKKMFFNLHEERNLIKIIKKVLNADFSQLMIDVRFFNI